MDARDFVYWLQGFVEVAAEAGCPPNQRQWTIIKDHLNECFTKVTPDRSVESGESPCALKPTTWPNIGKYC